MKLIIALPSLRSSSVSPLALLLALAISVLPGFSPAVAAEETVAGCVVPISPERAPKARAALIRYAHNQELLGKRYALCLGKKRASGGTLWLNAGDAFLNAALAAHQSGTENEALQDLGAARIFSEIAGQQRLTSVEQQSLADGLHMIQEIDRGRWPIL